MRDRTCCLGWYCVVLGSDQCGMPEPRRELSDGVNGMLLLIALVACSERPSQEGTALPSASDRLSEAAPAVPTVPPQATPSPPKWTDPIAVGHGVSQPVVEALLAGEEYEVPDPVTGTTRSMLHEQVQLDVPGQPDRVYPTSPSEGWVLVKARDRFEGPDVMLGYRLFWDTSQGTLGGDVGGFVVKETVIVQVGDEAPRVTWMKAGAFWEKRALQ